MVDINGFKAGNVLKLKKERDKNFDKLHRIRYFLESSFILVCNTKYKNTHSYTINLKSSFHRKS